MHEYNDVPVERFQVTVWEDDTFTVLLKDQEFEILVRDTSIDKAYIKALQVRILRKKAKTPNNAVVFEI